MIIVLMCTVLLSGTTLSEHVTFNKQVNLAYKRSFLQPELIKCHINGRWYKLRAEVVSMLRTFSNCEHVYTPYDVYF
jgi:hypothetical protein